MAKKNKKENLQEVTTEAQVPVTVNQAPESEIQQNVKNKKMTDEELRAAIKKEEEDRLRSTLLSKQTPFDITEAYKATRTNIMFSIKSTDPCKALIVSSANPGEGKSTTCANLAIAFAQMGDRVVIIDADMRKPRTHKYFDLKNKKGLSNILGGFETLESCINHKEDIGLDIITAGNIPPNPAELLASGEMDALLETLSGRYDYVFIDTPPINVVTDASILSKKVSGVVLVVRHNITNKEAVERSIKTLEFAGAKVLGFILNSVERKEYEGRYTYRSYRRGYRRYGYKKYGKYGYSKYGYNKYGYGKYGYSKYGYSKYGYKYGYGRYGYGNKYGYGYGDAYEDPQEKN